MNQDIKIPQQTSNHNAATEVSPGSTKKSKRPRVGSKKIFIVVLVLLLSVSIAVAAFFYTQYREIRDNPNAATVAETEDLVKRVGILITLPADETPTIATVSDREKLNDQPFFKDSKNDDKLLIYTNAKQAIIYRPSENKIINVGPIALSDTSEL